ncbi:NAD-dependent epimerase/dehydratase family protein [Kitasatospora xanthocidica]|uniref:NAD-dependent epimerase/dehydratase family protein n=1 Tax=Kitasatospora xanthocidica TaxID=83382 RepID=A0A372ZNH8_9ACTN|nr:NmrA family NAD(P)-binding protein [Kitasatospora xanthocidica]RGD57438.1 NAD-dependent epimerase/dehydratase family protein [Kitasatospora xanthocidica]
MTDDTDTARGTVAVTGATGRQGAATARRLLAGGRAVRALVRDPFAPAAVALAEAGAELVRADFDEPSGLEPALAGTAALFAVPPVAYGPEGTDHEREFTRGRALADAAAAAGVRQVVFTSVASTSGAAFAAPGKRRVEQYLCERFPLVTVLRPVRFMTNYFGTDVGFDGIVDGVHRHLFAPHEPLQVIAPQDIAEFAALAFEQPERFAGRTLELAGDDLTPVEAAAAISAATGIPVRYEWVTHEEAAALNPEFAEVRRQWAAGHRWHADIEALRVIHPGLRTLADWLAETGTAALRAHRLGAP